jgi:hypothetical protein
MIYYTVLKTPGKGAVNKDEIRSVRKFMYKIAEYVVTQTEQQIGKIPRLHHYEQDKKGRTREYDAFSKLFDMVSVPQYRPYEKYCHLDLSDILQCPAFKDFHSKSTSGLVVASM